MAKNRQSKKTGRRKAKGVTSGKAPVHNKRRTPTEPKNEVSSVVAGMFKRTVARIREIEKQALSKLRGKGGSK